MAIAWSDFTKIDMRVGTIIEACVSPKAQKPAYALTIDFGPLGILRSSAQITDLYTAEALVGQQVVAVVNFPPKQVATVMSECLVLGSIDEEGQVTLLQPERKVRNGDRIG